MVEIIELQHFVHFRYRGGHLSSGIDIKQGCSKGCLGTENGEMIIEKVVWTHKRTL